MAPKDLVPRRNNPEKVKTTFAGMLGSAAGVTDQADTKVDVITFVEAPWGLGMGSISGVPPLLPAQRFILKAYYGIPLDDTDRYIPIFDRFNENLLYTFTEQEFYLYLLEEGRISPGPLNGTRNTLALICGRRGTKTTVTSMIANYEMYCMMLQYHPQGYYGVMPDDPISMTCLSTSEENAKILYDRVTNNLERALFFRDYLLKSPNKTEMYLKSQRDIQDFGGGKYTIEFIAEACSARSTRGRNNIFVAFDEVAHFFKEIGSKSTSDKSDKAVYEAIIPSLAMYPNPDGSPAGKIILISSPADKSGLLWEEYERSFDEEKGGDILMIQLPSWEMNPKIPTAFLKSQYYKSPVVFSVEYGAEFSDRLSGWIEDADLVYDCVDEKLFMKERSSERIPYFMGIDVGLKNDGTAIAVTHVERDVVDGVESPVIVLDWIAVRYAKDEKTFDESTGKLQAFDPAEMADWIAEIHGHYNIHAGLLDQYYAMSVLPILKRKGILTMQDRHFNDTLNSEIYQNLMAKFMTRGIRLPASGVTGPNGKPEDSELVQELLKLQVLQKSKYVIKVFMPEGKDRHDDLSDALARSVKLASEYITGGGKGSKVPRTSKGRQGHMALSKNLRRMDLNRPSTGMIYKSGGGRYNGFGGGMGPGMGPGPRRR